MRPPIVIIRHTPIDVDLKMYETFAQLWQSPVTVLAETSFSPERIKCGYRESSPYFRTIILDKELVSLSSYIINHTDSIYIIYGLGQARNLLTILKQYNIIFGIVAERDLSLLSPTFTNRLRKIFHFIRKFRNKQVVSRIKFFLAMGQQGIDCYYKNYNVDKNILFNFMYCEGSDFLGINTSTELHPVKMIYIGRFDYIIKGLNTLLEAITRVKGNYSLDLVGGYGKNRKEVLENISHLPYVNYIGIWNNTEIVEKLNKYDVIIVPSNLDGWNLHCNMAIKAGIAAITTDGAVSDELISACGNGLVIPAGDIPAMTKALQKIIDKPQLLNIWKNKITKYVDSISNLSVAQYMVDVIEYTVLKTNPNRPKCPWVKE